MTGNIPPIYIVSGGTGDSGTRIVETVLVQFPGFTVPIIKKDHIRQRDEIKEVILACANENGTIIHTLVDAKLRKYLIELARESKVAAIDLMGPLSVHLTQILGSKPKGVPGLYRTLHQSYFDRVDAIDFTMNHDDGKNSQDLHLADIVVIGVSRSGKTPLSMYLAVLGWKVANIPIIIDTPLPEELFNIDRRRVVGLRIEFDQLEAHRKERQKWLNSQNEFNYTNPKTIFDEIEYADEIYKKSGFKIINVSDKAIESSASDIIELLTRRFGDKAKINFPHN